MQKIAQLYAIDEDECLKYQIQKLTCRRQARLIVDHIYINVYRLTFQDTSCTFQHILEKELKEKIMKRTLFTLMSSALRVGVNPNLSGLYPTNIGEITIKNICEN